MKGLRTAPESRAANEEASRIGPQLSVRSLAEPVTILVVDDHDAVLQALRELIAGVPGFDLVGEAHSGEEATTAVDSLEPQLVLMDVVMPGIGGIAAAEAIVSRHPGVAVVLTSIDDSSLDPRVLALGSAVGWSLKDDLSPGRLRELWELRTPPD